MSHSELYKEYKNNLKLQRAAAQIAQQIANEKRKQRKLQADALVMFWSEINAPSLDSCWRMGFNKELKRTTKHCYRIYERFKGSVPRDHELHHTCFNKWCVNPRHLVPLTFEEHLEVHGKIKRVKFRSRNKYHRLVRDLLQAESNSTADLIVDQNDIRLDQE